MCVTESSDSPGTFDCIERMCVAESSASPGTSDCIERMCVAESSPNPGTSDCIECMCVMKSLQQGSLLRVAVQRVETTTAALPETVG